VAVEIKRVTICGYYGYRNIGDEAILASIIESINNICDVEISTFSGNPNDTKKLHGVNSVYIGESIGSPKMFTIANIKNTYLIINTIRNTDLLIIGGGGIIHDRNIHGIAKFWINKIILGILFHKPMMIYAPGVGPLRTILGRFLTRYTIGSVDTITVRDIASKETLINSGVKEKLIHVTADPALSLTPVGTAIAREILNIEDVTHNKSLIGISVRWNPYEFGIHSKFLYEFKNIITELSDLIVEQLDVNLVFIPMQYPPRITCDITIMDEIHQKMKNKDRAKIIRGMYSPQEILGVVGQMDMMIGMRLHSLIFAARMNVPVVGLSYDTKTSEFLRMIGQDRWSCDYKNININNVFQNIYHVWINRDDIKRDLDVKVNELQIKSRYNAELARELLER